MSMKEMKVKTVTEAKSELLREKIVKMASTDRHVLEVHLVNNYGIQRVERSRKPWLYAFFIQRSVKDGGG